MTILADPTVTGLISAVIALSSINFACLGDSIAEKAWLLAFEEVMRQTKPSS
jgi:hypothetical protein